MKTLLIILFLSILFLTSVSVALEVGFSTANRGVVIGETNNYGSLDGNVSSSSISLISSFSNLSYISYYGSSLSGSSGDLNRSITLDSEIIQIDNYILHPTYDYLSTDNITFLFPVWDDQLITFWYNASLTFRNFYGSDFNGLDSDTNRNMSIVKPSFLIIDNMFAIENIGYSWNNGTLSILSNLWDDQKVTVWG